MRVFDLQPRGDRMFHAGILTGCAVQTPVAYGAFAGVSVDIICTCSTVEAWPRGTFIHVYDHMMIYYFKYLHNTIIYIYPTKEERVICYICYCNPIVINFILQ